MDEYPDRVIPITYHTYFEGSSIDDLGIGLSGTYSRLFKTGATLNLNINRKAWNLTILPGSKEQNKVTWYEKGEFDTEAIAAVAIRHTWDSVSRKVEGYIDVTFEQAPSGDPVSVGLFIVEDSVIGGPRYDQYTDYLYHGNYPELEKWGTEIEEDSVHFASGHWIEGYPHHWSFRESILEGDFWGTTTAIPTDAEVGKTYSVPFEHTMPADYHGLTVRDKQVSLVALVSYKEIETINAESANLVSDAVAIGEHASVQKTAIEKMSCSKNEIHCYLPRRGEYALKIHNLLGRQVYQKGLSASKQGMQSIAIGSAALPAGAYLLVLESDGQQLEHGRVILY